MKIVYLGKESSGKSLSLARDFLNVLHRNEFWLKKYSFSRPIFTNLNINSSIVKKTRIPIILFSDVSDLLRVSGADIFIDEISSHFSALKNDPLPLDVNNWLRQGAKQGVHIYSTAQEFHDIHVHFRRRVFRAYHCHKMIGSRRPAKNIPPVDSIWGVIRNKELVIDPYDELNPQYKMSFFPFDSFLITKELCSVYETNQLIASSAPMPLKHEERKCDVCGKVVIRHY